MMSASTRHNAYTASQRRVPLDCAFVASATNLHSQCGAYQDASSHDVAQRKRLLTIALAVLVLHAFVLFEMRRAFDSPRATPQTLVVEMEFSAAHPARALTAVPQVPAPQAQPHPEMKPQAAAPQRPRLNAVKPAPVIHDARHAPPAPPVAGTAPLARETPPIASPAPPAAAAHANDAGAAAPEPSSPQPSPQPSPNVEPAPQTVTAPSFGAAYLHNPAPPYPALAQQRGWQGTVLLKVHVLASGRPDHVSVTSSSGHDSLDDAASEAIANWSFVPARRGEQAVDGWVQVPIEFKLGT